MSDDKVRAGHVGANERLVGFGGVVVLKCGELDKPHGASAATT